ncbi:MAG TPA: FkbM family methyltransferase [Aliidongia sp.]|uniref:FkbM family methyltransferase n=1 Tax=Aliidongia sp. TaxID=1914230 RepID=UPI002DDCE5D8|nr:FkbM family methyltransferase [Aliidongia sp.]HEV2676004.1 FkbM family methyltransferase [Aliidongia sp.]
MFVSYAQNGEDILLYRALGGVQHGRYVDVGAADPISDSVTLAFYQRGWRGINLEPSPIAFQRLAALRPDDINLNLAVGDVEGTSSFFMVQGADVLSTASSDQLQALRTQGFHSSEIRVSVRRLQSILAAHPIGPVHFLKIDVEGFERAVLAGADLKNFRPWIILIEATAPNSQVPTHDQWEDLLIAADYRCVWFDGLNRYYVSAEKAELADAFQVQPNVFDRYVKHSEALAKAQLSEANTRLAQMAGRQQELETALEAARAELARYRIKMRE